ncbi:MAG: PQQ-dependent sugar dehydrogenase [Thermodesulfobacteriota bacterium]
MVTKIKLTFLIVLLTIFLPITGCRAKIALDLIELPPGFTIELYADNLPGARSLALSPNGTLFVGTRDKGVVYAVTNLNGDQRAKKIRILARGLNMPNGVAFHNGALYVAEVNRILKYAGIEKTLDSPGRPQVIYDQLPRDNHHGWKFIRFGPDGLLYVPVGAPCNICEPGDPYAAILRLRPETSKMEVFARGVRNTVGFDWQPGTGTLWFTDNGRDRLGDDLPSDELNHAPRAGMHFGYPYLHASRVIDPKYGDKLPPELVVTPPAFELGAHVAPLGMRFYQGEMFPEKYRGRIFLAEHGSWNRSSKVGYRLVSVVVEGGKATRQEVFARGWLQGEKAWGRPVDLLVMPDGSLLVSDDRAGVIYRISYSAD